MNSFVEIKQYQHKMTQQVLSFFFFLFYFHGNLHVLLIKVKSTNFTETKQITNKTISNSKPQISLPCFPSHCSGPWGHPPHLRCLRCLRCVHRAVRAQGSAGWAGSQPWAAGSPLRPPSLWTAVSTDGADTTVYLRESQNSTR